MKELLRKIGFGILVVIIAGVGVYLGMSFKGMQASQDTEFLDSSGPSSKLQVNMSFPEVNLLALDSSSVQSTQLVRDHGSVFFFMEIGCPPCEVMSQKWQKLINEGKLDRNLVTGISYEPPDNVWRYAKKNGLTFPIYVDTGAVFMNQYGVMNYPLAVVVGKSGLIKMYTFDSRLDFDANELQKQMAD